MIHILASPADIEARQFAGCAARCARQGWTLRACAEGYELLGLGPRATFGRLESVVVWLDKQDKTKDTEEIECVQTSFLTAA